MKRIFALLLAIVLVMGLVSCGKQNTATAAQLIAALEKAGYMVEEDYDDDDPLVGYDFRADILEERCFYFGRFGDVTEEYGYAVYLSFTDEDSAVSFYEEFKDELGRIEESSGKGFAKSVSTTEYWTTYIVSRVKETVIFIEVDWYDYQVSGLSYDHAVEKALESLGY